MNVALSQQVFLSYEQQHHQNYLTFVTSLTIEISHCNYCLGHSYDYLIVILIYNE